MHFSQKFLEHERFRWTVLKLATSLLLLVVLVSFAWSIAVFVRESQELNEHYKRTHSHVYDQAKESACYGCKCSDVGDQFVCLHCQCDNGTHVIPDTPQQTFERCYATMLLKVCPSLATSGNTVAGAICHNTVYALLRTILFSQERILSLAVNTIEVLLLFLYSYFYPYSYYHEYLDEDKRVQLAKETEAVRAVAARKYTSPAEFKTQ